EERSNAEFLFRVSRNSAWVMAKCTDQQGIGMRILDHRYNRDLRRHDLALRMIRHEVRTATIMAWTGLSGTRIRRLYRSYIPEGAIAALRHRGPPPTSVELLLRSKELAGEAGGVAGRALRLGA